MEINFFNLCKNIVNILDLSLFKLTSYCEFYVSILSRNVVTCEIPHGFVDRSKSIYNFSEVLVLALNVLKPFEHAITVIGKKFRKPEGLFCCLSSFNLVDAIHIDELILLVDILKKEFLAKLI